MKITLTSPDLMPTRGTPGSAGWDLKAAHDEVIPVGGHRIVQTGVSMEIPRGYAGIIFPRSGLALKHGIQTHMGVIDSDYRGEIGVILFNHGHHPVRLNAGERVAQLLIIPIDTSPLDIVDTLTDTTRGKNGYGSTGA